MSAGWIRVMKLFPGSWDEEIEFELIPPTITPPSYKVLSYVWGSRNNKRPIILWDSWTGRRSVVYVTVNLDHALRRIRRADSHLILWVDAICINQTNVAERSIQVRFMREIFANSEEVVVYLGEPRKMDEGSLVSPPSVLYLDDRDSQHMISFKEWLGCEVAGRKGGQDTDYGLDVFCLVRILAESRDRLSDKFWDQLNQDSVYQRNLFEALRAFMRCKWWSRVWTVQEIIVPREVTVYYGGAVAPWRMFVAAASFCRQGCCSSLRHEYRCVVDNYSHRILEVEKRRERWRRNERSDLLSVLRQFGDRQATEPQDRIYALLGLSNEESRIMPDYSLSISEVFQNTVLHIIHRTQSLDVFLGDVGRKADQAFPSWVPDWSTAAQDDVELLTMDDTGAESCQWCRTLRTKYAHHFDLVRFVKSSSLWRLRPTNMPTIDGAFDWLCTVHGGHSDVFSEDFGVISMPGLYVDMVIFVADPMFSTDARSSTLKSWATMAAEQFADRQHQPQNEELGDVFCRTLCADTIGVDDRSRRLSIEDIDAVTAWLMDQPHLRETLYKHHICRRRSSASDTPSIYCACPRPGPRQRPTGEEDERTDVSPAKDCIDEAVRVATHKRRFFITREGYIGLGPTRMQVDDLVYVVPGSKTPLILRNAGSGTVDRQHEIRGRNGLELVGDCYTHGIMDGEAAQRRRLDLSWRLQQIAVREKWRDWTNSESAMAPMTAKATAELHGKQPDIEASHCGSEKLEVLRREVERRLCDAQDSLQAATDEWLKSLTWESCLLSRSRENITTHERREKSWRARQNGYWERRKRRQRTKAGGETLGELGLEGLGEGLPSWSPRYRVEGYIYLV
ncbi:hypothetical protein CP532_2990 [Ophiocordyceps camponoti-leonardi (nom. inval.)]|nr:hypothetical protein CP532_2990 [Ophiocordyceps camponoti-leonardi (nom. inval.)]